MKIGITNLKGGCGKSTISFNLAVSLAHLGYSVVLVDTDTNRNTLHWYAARDETLPKLLAVGTVDPKALAKTVGLLNDKHDFVIMDGTPNLSQMSTTIILASDLLLIPVRPGANDFRALDEFMTSLEKAKEYRDDVQARFIINEYNDKITTYRGIKEHLKNNYEIPILETVIKTRIAYVESSINGTGVIEQSDPKAKAEIESLTKEILQLTSSVLTHEKQ